jgi:tRNA G18 (ribose-2'-O)-methylase SpoU
MTRVPISNLDDPRLAIYRSLKATNQTRRLGQFVVEGERLVARLLESRFPTVSVLVTDRHERRLATLVPESVPTYVVPHELIDTLVGFPFHRGILACGERRPWPSVDQFARGNDHGLTLVVCPQLSNPENLGAIARIGDVFGIDGILAGPTCPDPFSRRVLRVSMGSILRIPVVVSERLGDILHHLAHEDQVELWAAVADPAALPFDGVSRPHRLALVLGEEDRGIEPEWIERCQRIITIPMRPGAGSLNVAVAAGILIHGLTRSPHADFSTGIGLPSQSRAPSANRPGSSA